MKHILKIVITLYYDQRSSLTLACRKDELDELELDAIGALYKAVGGWLYVVVKTGDMLQFLLSNCIHYDHDPRQSWWAASTYRVLVLIPVDSKRSEVVVCR